MYKIKRNGFTLVELMAVIIIISLIALLTFPNIINQIKKTKKSNNKMIEDVVIEQAKKYVSDNKEEFQDDDGYCLSIDTLVDKGYVNEQLVGINNKDNDVIMMIKKDVFSYKIVNKNDCDVSEYQNIFVDNEGKKYERVEYLKSTGTQYIDTGIKLNQNSRVKIKYQYSSGSSTARVFGDAHDSSKGWILTTARGSINTKIQTLYGNIWTPTFTESQNIVPSTDVIEFERNGVNQYVNGNLYYSNSNSTFETNSTAIVFGAYYNSLALSSIKLYELWIWEDGTNVSRHFIPCYRTSDGMPGLCDKVTKEFYQNEGTGEFLYG